MADETTTATETPIAETTAAETTQAAETKAGETTQAAEVKPADSKAAEVKAGDSKSAEPVDYAKALSEVPLPEGITLDPEQAKAGTELFAKHGLSADAVKDLVSLYATQQKAGADGNAKAFADQVTAWKGEAEKSTTAEERGAAKEAALKVFGAEEMKLLDTFGITNRAGFIKALAQVGKAIRDDSYVAGNAAANGVRDARALFPNSNMNP